MPIFVFRVHVDAPPVRRLIRKQHIREYMLLNGDKCRQLADVITFRITFRVAT
ncbi:hypothetical protein Psi02_12000 [Planotetraspora silvatica]|uniref:Uncharacterized protein n=1 Tax=Planotetraspora silvatica TaxID=234614 RepID=A0A8J3UK67_9ACTN|nr:hypothetical protein [Planotetraspora silvatica]GII44776.1 hypothetical protein Psi02_12000 [Planotetraspora silvatica]